MNRKAVLLLLSLNWLAGIGNVLAQGNISLFGDSNNVTLSMNSFELDKSNLKINFEIQNNSSHEIWLGDEPFWIYFGDDDMDLFITKRRGTSIYFEESYVKYTRLKAGEKHNETISLKVPIGVLYIDRRKPRDTDFRGIVYAKRVILEIGYYEDNLPEAIFELLEESERTINNNLIDVNDKYFQPFPAGIMGFMKVCEELKNREEEVELSLNYQLLKNESVLGKIIEDPNLPCTIAYSKYIQYEMPSNLISATRIKLNFKPSIFEYFYPHQSQQSLFNNNEIEYLKSENSATIENKEKLKSLISEIRDKSDVHYGLTNENKEAQISLYKNDDLLTSFKMHNDVLIEEATNHYFKFYGDQDFIRILIPQIWNFEYRLECATNLKNLWYRLRYYNIFEGERQKNLSIMSKKIYPDSANWCDALYPYQSFKSGYKIFICPAVSNVKCNYAMNPNCKPDSPGNMVLLFEAKIGWNQHGGPELFTFDNHDPKGGCVLFNDGTVKFIQTEEELKKLRWK